MADQTIHDETLDNSVSSGDEIIYWKTGSSVTRRATRAAFVGGVFSGNGTWINNGFIFTVPATGTAALLGVAQTFTAAKTFSAVIAASAGINFGGSTLSAFVDAGTWTPAITGSSSNPTVTYTTQVGKYSRIGKFVVFGLRIVINTISGGGGTTRISMPLAVSSDTSVARGIAMGNFDLAGTPYQVAIQPRPGASDANLSQANDDAAEVALDVTTLAAADQIDASGFYWMD